MTEQQNMFKECKEFEKAAAIFRRSENEVMKSLVDMGRRSMWAVVYGLVPYKDGDKWCVLLGDNLQDGIAGFGDSPEEAINAFDVAMRPKAKP